MSNTSSQRHHEMISDTFLAYAKYHHSKSEKTEKAGEMLGLSAHNEDPFPTFRRVEQTGVIYATSRARERGFHPDDATWANMGQGAPETGPIDGAPARKYEMTIPDDEVEYAPNTGIPELREKVAEYYNHLYRQGMDSQYTASNVCIVPGGRAGLTRIMAAMAQTQVGFFSPDYTAYEQALGLFQRIAPTILLHRDMNQAIMTPEEFEFQCVGRGLGAVLLSNPANPTGQSIEGDSLKEYVRIGREHNVALIMDEFYSHYYYDGSGTSPFDGGPDDDTNWPKTVSSSRYIDDVNEDPILIVNGLTKNWRCPGFRCCWVVAPASIVSLLGSAGSYLDGGANAPLQRLALPLMDLDFIRRDAWALQRHFKDKRDFLLKELENVGIVVKWQPTATFYIWADLSNLPPPLNDCLIFLEECTKHKIIIVPGCFFDVNPRSVRHVDKSQCISNVRFSYGPSFGNLKIGMKNIKEMVAQYRRRPMSASTYLSEEVRQELAEEMKVKAQIRD